MISELELPTSYERTKSCAETLELYDCTTDRPTSDQLDPIPNASLRRVASHPRPRLQKVGASEFEHLDRSSMVMTVVLKVFRQDL